MPTAACRRIVRDTPCARARDGPLIACPRAVIVLEPAQIVHRDARTRTAFSMHAFTDMEDVVCDEAVDPLSLTLRYVNDVPYTFFVFARDKQRLVCGLKGRAHLFSTRARRAVRRSPRAPGAQSPSCPRASTSTWPATLTG